MNTEEQRKDDDEAQARRDHLHAALWTLGMTLAGLIFVGALIGAGHLIADDAGITIGAFAAFVLLIGFAEKWVVPGTGERDDVDPGDEEDSTGSGR